jgi:hypothetical protein
MVAIITKHLLVRGTSVLVPATARDLGILVRQHRNVPLNTILRGPHRSRQQEEWYRKIVAVVADGVDMAPQNLHNWLKEKGGFVVLKSCADMDDAEFQAFVTRAVDTLFKEVLPGVRRADVIAEAERLADCGW